MPNKIQPELPREIWTEIFSYLEGIDLGQLALSSKELYVFVSGYLNTHLNNNELLKPAILSAVSHTTATQVKEVLETIEASIDDELSYRDYRRANQLVKKSTLARTGMITSGAILEIIPVSVLISLYKKTSALTKEQHQILNTLKEMGCETYTDFNGNPEPMCDGVINNKEYHCGGKVCDEYYKNDALENDLGSYRMICYTFIALIIIAITAVLLVTKERIKSLNENTRESLLKEKFTDSNLEIPSEMRGLIKTLLKDAKIPLEKRTIAKAIELLTNLGNKATLTRTSAQLYFKINRYKLFQPNEQKAIKHTASDATVIDDPSLMDQPVLRS